jgi:Exo70 exocyst complex subunit
VDGGVIRAVSPDSSPAIPPEGLVDVKKLCETLEDCECDEHFGVYKKVRVELVQTELRACETAAHTAWEELLQDVPFRKGTHPLKGYLSLAVELLRGEQLLWGATLSSSDASIEVFLSIADVIIVEIQRTLTPTLIDEESSDGSKTTTEQSAVTPLVVQPSSAAAGAGAGISGSIAVQHGSSFSAKKLFRLKGFSLNLAKPKPLIFRSVPDKINRQCNLFLIRLDALEIFLSRYEDMITLCLPDTRVDSLAAESLIMMRDAIVESCVESVSQVIAATAENTKKQRRHSNAGTGSGSGAGSSASTTAPEQESLTCDLQPITGNILYCCKELMHFTKVYGKMHELAMELGIRVSASAPTLTDLIAVLLQNLVELLLKRADKLDPVGKTKVSRSLNLKGHALFESGERDADDYLLWARKHLFLVNNLYSLSVYIQEKRKDMQMYTNAAASGMGSALSGAGKPQGAKSVLRLLELSDQVESRLANERERFCATVAEAMSMTPAEMSEFAVEYETADKTTRHRLLKAKFSLFTSGMDALLAQQGELRVSVAGLRDALGDQLLDTIYPFYNKLYENYSTVAFSKKHMNEYLRFSPRDVERSLKYFFGKGQ